MLYELDEVLDACDLAADVPGQSGHHAASELFFIIDGRLDVLVGAEVRTAGAGDLLVVPPGLAHAFAAHRGSPADALIVITPGVERFDYFRHVERMRVETSPPTPC